MNLVKLLASKELNYVLENVNHNTDYVRNKK